MQLQVDVHHLDGKLLGPEPRSERWSGEMGIVDVVIGQLDEADVRLATHLPTGRQVPPHGVLSEDLAAST